MILARRRNSNCFAICPSGDITADKRFAFGSPKLPNGSASFIRQPLGVIGVGCNGEKYVDKIISQFLYKRGIYTKLRNVNRRKLRKVENINIY